MIFITFADYPDGREITVGPFEFAQIRYSEVDVGEPEPLCYQGGERGGWIYRGEEYSDIIIGRSVE